MQAATTAGRECWKCRAGAGEALVCARCGAVQPLPAGVDLFAILGLPRRLALDVTDLEQRYLAASRAVHPDRHQTASPEERELSLAASAAVNRSYRTLRDPVARGRYWLELNGTRLGDDGPAVPAAIADLVFETQEKLAELRGAGAGAEKDALRTEVAEIRARFTEHLTGLRGQLADRYAAPRSGPTLDELRQRLAEIAYLNTLLGDIEETIEEGSGGTHRRH